MHGNVLPGLASLRASIRDLGCTAGLSHFVHGLLFAAPGRRQAALSFAEQPPDAALDAAAASAPPMVLPAPSAAHLSLFTATWNLGEQGPPSSELLASWLPKGRHVYALALQECLHVPEFTAAALGALGRLQGQDGAYTAHCHSIGSSNTSLGFHGYIVVLVLVRADLERSGDFAEVHVAARTVHRGKKILPKWLMRRQPNKGAVGCAFRCHGTTIAFVAAHLASDTKGRSNLDGRLADTRALLEGMELAYDLGGFELQLCCHHVVLLGDLNYRVAMPAPEALELMASGDWEGLRGADELSSAM